jgi:hypothetical protein
LFRKNLKGGIRLILINPARQACSGAGKSGDRYFFQVRFYGAPHIFEHGEVGLFSPPVLVKEVYRLARGIQNELLRHCRLGRNSAGLT